MDCSFIEERNRLAHIVALLLLFAFRVERVAFGSWRERRHMLELARAAEASGLRMAAEYGSWEEGTELPNIGDGYSREHALRLAVSLRAVAMALYFHVRRFDAYSSAVRDWVAQFTLKLEAWEIFATGPVPYPAAVPLIDTS